MSTFNIILNIFSLPLQVWFKNRRAKWRKTKREDEAARRAAEGGHPGTSAGTSGSGETPDSSKTEEEISVTDEELDLSTSSHASSAVHHPKDSKLAHQSNVTPAERHSMTSLSRHSSLSDISDVGSDLSVDDDDKKTH